MLRKIGLAVTLCLAWAVTASAADVGEYGYRHMEYHDWGSIQELKEKTGKSCCDGAGECRATYVNMQNRTAYLEGRWCRIPDDTPIRKDVSLPEGNLYALVCAGALSKKGGGACPPMYCIALPENQ